MIIEQFELEKHFEKIEFPREYELSVCPKYNMYERLFQLSQRGPTYTALENGTLIGIGGIAIYWDRVGEAWLFLTEHVNKYWPRVHKSIKKYLNETIDKYDFKRIQAAIRTDFLTGRRWVEKLGFKEEGLMRKYGPEGADYTLYALIVED